jgi:hypothetical protein
MTARRPAQVLVLAVVLSLSACAGKSQAPTADDAAGAAAPTSAEPKEPEMTTTTVLVSVAEPATIAAAAMKISLVEVRDSRCPKGVTCIWAGHAAVSLRVERDGAADEVIQIGTEAPADTQLPFDAEVGPWRLHLLALEPYPIAGTEVAQSEYRARIDVSRR